ncbi:hypothetical protein C8Q78DRAFT_824986 [Trametes maxima]|nr:hypothetical protein C8Q78DRAFT_824986 [Trametes maxima]
MTQVANNTLNKRCVDHDVEGRSNNSGANRNGIEANVCIRSYKDRAVIQVDQVERTSYTSSCLTKRPRPASTSISTCMAQRASLSRRMLHSSHKRRAHRCKVTPPAGQDINRKSTRQTRAGHAHQRLARDEAHVHVCTAAAFLRESESQGSSRPAGDPFLEGTRT